MRVAWALSLVNPAPLRLRRLGYVRQSGLLHARSRRCRRAWAPHLERAQAAIAAAADATRRKDLCVVLGSGLLDDVPLAHPAAAFARVCVITDALQREEDRAGRRTDILDLMHGLRLPPPDAAWDWEIAPFGAASRRYRLIHRVHAYPDWAAARGLSDPASPRAAHG